MERFAEGDVHFKSHAKAAHAGGTNPEPFAVERKGQMSGEQNVARVHIERVEGFQFAVDFPDAPGTGMITVDEAPPLGSGAGPNPARLLAAALGSCLAASLVFCLKKARVEPNDVSADVTATIVRNERGRFRIGDVDVELSFGTDEESAASIERCQGLFEDFCIVTVSVRHGIPVHVHVEKRQGTDFAIEAQTA
jgi:uncharacterized OsmC-like protein